MSDLQLGLLAIGVVVVVGVIVYNKLQETRLRRSRADADFGSRHEDVLLGRGRSLEPSPLEDASEEAERRTIPRDIEHTLTDTMPEPAPSTWASPPGRAVSAQGGPRVLEEAVDFIVSAECPTTASGADILKHAETLAHEAMRRPIHWEALDPGHGEWEQPSGQKRYRRVRAGMQLASRAGSATEEDIGAFCLGVQEIGLALGADLEMPDPEEAVRRAADLDRFCADVDVQVGLNVVAADAETFPGTKIRALAESAGMQYGKDGRFHRLSESGGELFGLANLEAMPFHAETMRTLATRGVTIVLDVPRAPAAASTFRAYVEFARQAEHSLGGTLVDDNGKPINQAAVDSIAMQLEAIHKTMSARGIEPGGPLALRLFS
jgi:FtsZ-interacting cell division protein ZipA